MSKIITLLFTLYIAGTAQAKVNTATGADQTNEGAVRQEQQKIAEGVDQVLQAKGASPVRTEQLVGDRGTTAKEKVAFVQAHKDNVVEFKAAQRILQMAVELRGQIEGAIIANYIALNLLVFPPTRFLETFQAATAQVLENMHHIFGRAVAVMTAAKIAGDEALRRVMAPEKYDVLVRCKA